MAAPVAVKVLGGFVLNHKESFMFRCARLSLEVYVRSGQFTHSLLARRLLLVLVSGIRLVRSMEAGEWTASEFRQDRGHPDILSVPTHSISLIHTEKRK